MDAFETYKQYCALKSHFYTKHYDYFKYNGRVRASKISFEKRPDKYFFYKLSKHKNVLDFLVANFVYSGDKWVGDLIGKEEPEKRYRQYLKIKESLTYIFKEEINSLDNDLNSLLIVTDGQHPPLLRKYLRQELSIETLIILNDVLGFFKHWNKKIIDVVLWPDVFLKCKKYKSFFTYDKQKMKAVMLEKWQGISYNK